MNHQVGMADICKKCKTNNFYLKGVLRLLCYQKVYKFELTKWPDVKWWTQR
jgi:hypothetical protein